jgi:hypothetical protein
MTVTNATSFANAVKALVNAVNTTAGTRTAGTVVIASGGSALKGIAPGLRPVTGVSVGRVVDTMQSRRNALQESRVLVSL